MLFFLKLTHFTLTPQKKGERKQKGKVRKREDGGERSGREGGKGKEGW